MELERRINRIVLEEASDKSALSFHQMSAPDCLHLAPFMKVFLVFANLPLLYFLVVSCIESVKTTRAEIFVPVLCSALVCGVCLLLTAINSRRSRIGHEKPVECRGKM